MVVFRIVNAPPINNNEEITLKQIDQIRQIKVHLVWGVPMLRKKIFVMLLLNTIYIFWRLKYELKFSSVKLYLINRSPLVALVLKKVAFIDFLELSKDTLYFDMCCAYILYLFYN